LDEPGKLIRITPDGAVGDPVAWASLETDGVPFATAFPFVVTPPQVDPDPIFTPEDIVGGHVTEPQDDNGGPPDEASEDAGEDIGPEPPSPAPPLTCWQGWKEVPRGWSAKGWRVKHKRRGNRVIFCAHPVAPPSGGNGLPEKPRCDGGKIIAIMSLPPRWRCVCPEGARRIETGRNAFACKGAPGGGDAKKDCVRKGGIWTGNHCILREPPRCPPGFVGKPPHCKKRIIDKCPPGFIGTWPNCKKVVLKKPGDQLKDAKKALKDLERQQKKD
jgi:hypothetical protein